MTPCGLCALLSQPALFEDDLWHVRHIDPPWGAAGWMMMVAKRHVAGPGYFDDREAASYGPSLRRFARALEEVTGALRIYTAALGEMHPHFHCHLVPRLPDPSPKGWAVFDLQRAAAAGEVVVSLEEVERISSAYRAVLQYRFARPDPAEDR